MKKALHIIFTIILVLQNPFRISAETVEKITETPLSIQMEAASLDVLVPTAFLIQANGAGHIVAGPKSFDIDNYSVIPVKVTEFTWTKDDARWELTDFATQANPPANSNKYALGLDFRVGDKTYLNEDITNVISNDLLVGHVTEASPDGITPVQDRSILFNYSKKLGIQTGTLTEENDTKAGKFSISFTFDEPLSAAETFKDKSVGTVVKYGDYDWRVLKEDEFGNMLIITEQIVGGTRFNGTSGNVYDGSRLHSAMKAFYDGGAKPTGVTWVGNGLDASMRSIAKPVNLPFEWGTSSNNTTRHNSEVASGENSNIFGVPIAGPTCFALSWREVSGDSNTALFASDSERQATDIPGHENTDIPGVWWLRSPGSNSTNAIVVGGEGGVGTGIGIVFTFGIRPALWINPNP